MALEVGHQLQQGRYAIQELLSQGGMGVIYLAEDRNLPGHKVAIKENTETAATTQQQFQYEAVMLSRLTHPNLPRVTDHFVESSGAQYLVMDYVPGDDLRTILHARAEPLPEDLVLKWMDQIMSALIYMHNWVDPFTKKPTPIIHRDIKPGNIKRTPNGRVVLVDFGIAKYEEPTEGTVLGAKGRTPGFSPLEQYTGHTDARSDIYALGATCYRLLTNQRPPDSTAIAAGTPLRSPRFYNPNISRTTERVIVRAMALQAADRYQSVADMREALKQKGDTAHDPVPISAHTDPASDLKQTQLSPLGQTRWSLWSALATLAALILLGAFFIIMFNSGFVNLLRLPVPPSPPAQGSSAQEATNIEGEGTAMAVANWVADSRAAITSTSALTSTSSSPVTATSVTATSFVSAPPAMPSGTPTESLTDVLAVTTSTETPPSVDLQQEAIAAVVSRASTITATSSFSTSIPASTSRETPTATPTRRPVTPTHTPPVTDTATVTPTGIVPTKPGALLINEIDGARYRFVPAGSFTRGSTVEPDEMPIHEVDLDAFWIMETEVTNALYGQCVAADACTAPANDFWQDEALANHPVTHVDWTQANAYAQWSGGRLPTEAEWEKAARGTDQRLFPWPDDESVEHGLNVNSTTTMPVGSFPESASPYKVLDMAGNVEEWIADWYGALYYAESPTQNPQGPEDGIFRVVRGGSFTGNRGAARTANRDRALPDSSFATVGFRTVIPASE